MKSAKDNSDENNYPIKEHLKCTICKAEIPFVVHNEQGRANFLRCKIKHKDYAKSVGEVSNCEGVYEPKKRQVKEQKKQEASKEEKRPLWTLDNMSKSRGLSEFLDALDTLVILNKTPNPIRRNGILLVGPYGSGKSIMVRAAMTHCKYKDTFHYIEMGGKFTSFDHKETGTAIDDIFKNAMEDAKGAKKRMAVLFVDEIAGTVNTRKKASRTQKVLIDAILRSITDYPDVIVIGTTNDTSEVDHAIINSGRFDIIHVKRATTPEERTQILRAHMVVPLSYVQFDNRIFDNLIAYEKRHNNYEGGRDYEDWTMDVSKWCFNNQKWTITPEEFDELLKHRYQQIKKKETEQHDDKTTSPDAGFVYPEEEEMIDFLIKNVVPRLKQNWIIFKDKWEQKGCVGNQLEMHLKPAYKKAKERVDKQKNTEEQHQTGFKGDGTKARYKKEESKTENNEEPKTEKNEENEDAITADEFFDYVKNEKSKANNNKTEKKEENKDMKIEKKAEPKPVKETLCAICKKPKGDKDVTSLYDDGPEFIHENCIDAEIQREYVVNDNIINKANVLSDYRKK